jgi:hypothetical protein
MTTSVTTIAAPSAPSSYGPVLVQLEEWRLRRTGQLTPSNFEALKEVRRRIERLESSLDRLMQLNHSLLTQLLPEITFDAETGTLTAKLGDAMSSIRFERANPDVPVQVGSIGSVATYEPKAKPLEPAEQVRQKVELEDLLEGYYYNAHRVLKLLQSLPTLKNLKCKEIIVVRNKLIEHADHGDIYSFGVSHGGPVIKPVVPVGRVWQDAGLLPNTTAFVAALLAALR